MKSAFVMGGMFRVYEDGTVNTIIDGKETASRKTIMRKKNAATGYVVISVKDDNGREHRFFAHRLVALGLIPNADGKPFINHIDGNKENNSVANLEWVTARENLIHAYKTGLRKSNKYGFPVARALIEDTT